jgi:hypothetical protein
VTTARVGISLPAATGASNARPIGPQRKQSSADGRGRRFNRFAAKSCAPVGPLGRYLSSSFSMVRKGSPVRVRHWLPCSAEFARSVMRTASSCEASQGDSPVERLRVPGDRNERERLRPFSRQRTSQRPARLRVYLRCLVRYGHASDGIRLAPLKRSRVRSSPRATWSSLR